MFLCCVNVGLVYVMLAAMRVYKRRFISVMKRNSVMVVSFYFNFITLHAVSSHTKKSDTRQRK